MSQSFKIFLGKIILLEIQQKFYKYTTFNKDTKRFRNIKQLK